MHTTDTIRRYKIFSQEDWKEIVFDENALIEVYAKNMTFHCTEIEGSLLLRGEGCLFPELKHINGNISIDAKHCELPVLETVERHFTMHCETKLPELTKVRGNFKCIVDAVFKNLEIIGGYISVKNAAVYAKNRKLLKTRIVISISYQFQADVLMNDGAFDINIIGDNIVIPHQEIRGKINIEGKNISFPNLKFVHGSLRIGSENQSGDKFTHHFPELKKLIGNLRLEKTSISFQSLQEMGGALQLDHGSYAVFPAMEKSGNIMVSRTCNAAFPVLKEVNGSIQNYGTDICYLHTLQKVAGTFNNYRVVAPNIIEVDDLIMAEQFDFQHLKRVNGRIQSNSKVNFKSLEYLGILGDSRLEGSHFPGLNTINNYLYGTDQGFEHLAKNVYFKITDGIYLSKDKFIIARLHFDYIFGQPTHSMKKLVGILKLRHSSFQNFKTREYERQWGHFQSQFFTAILNKIERLWDETEPIAFEEFFNTADRNFKLFCFSYYGVGNLMKKLEAKKINEAEIEVAYLEYDKNGNAISTQKMNRYEVHEVENQKLGMFVWGGRQQYSYAVKCWCPSTKKEHWLWIEREYKDDALTAIASTFRIHANIIPHIECLKRQGDLLICELKEKVTPTGEIRPLTASEYFNLLRAET